MRLFKSDSYFKTIPIKPKSNHPKGGGGGLSYELKSYHCLGLTCLASVPIQRLTTSFTTLIGQDQNFGEAGPAPGRPQRRGSSYSPEQILTLINYFSLCLQTQI